MPARASLGPIDGGIANRTFGASRRSSGMMQEAMRVTLIHNDDAGDGEHSASELVSALSRAGCHVTYFALDACDLAAAVALPADVIAIAGGDGSIAKVARHARPNDRPLAVLPLGTANNIAKCLNCDRSVAELASAWRTASLHPFYPVQAVGPWGEMRLIEGMGFGAIEAAIAAMSKKPDVKRARKLLAGAVQTATPEWMHLEFDGTAVETPLAVLEITTMPLLGPNLLFAPAADPSDRKVEICWTDENRERRQALSDWLADSDPVGPAPVNVASAESLTIMGEYHRVRLDGKIWPDKNDPASGNEPGPIKLTVEAEPLLFLVPG